MEIIDAGRVRIGISATRISGCDYVDVRAYSTDLTGQLRPTSNGLTIPIECLDQVLKAAKKEQGQALQLERATLYYFRESVEDKTAAHSVLNSRVFSKARDAVDKTPQQHGADKPRGYIFKSSNYSRTSTACMFQPSKPFAVWDREAEKWVRWERRHDERRHEERRKK